MSVEVKPIFIISLVRSGSTLLQRILMGHDKIASMAEPWFLLPLVFSMKKEGIITEYGHSIAHDALEDLIDNLPNKSEDYYSFLREFAGNIYGALSKSKNSYFLDKTPRYYMIIPELAKIFPEAKFIFLFRNPVHIYSSILSTWKDNRLKFTTKLHNDLTNGPKLMSQGYELLKNRSYSIQYEKFVKNPEESLKEIVDYLNIDYDDKMLDNFYGQDLKGRSVDPTGTKRYKQVDSSTLHKWKKVFNTKYRKKIIANYIESIDAQTLSIQGYKKSEILNEIRSLDHEGNFSMFRDLLDINKPKIRLAFHKSRKKISYYLNKI